MQSLLHSLPYTSIRGTVQSRACTRLACEPEMRLNVQNLQQVAAAWKPDVPNTAGVHELLSSFFARYTKSSTP